MSLGTIILIALVIVLIGGAAGWPYGPWYGAGPIGGGAIGTALIIVLILILIGKL